MDDYNFLAHLFDTFQSSPDWIKALWLLIPPAFVLALITLTMRFRIESKRADKALDGELIYSVHRDAQNRVHIVSHTKHLGETPPLLFLDQGDGDAFEYAEGEPYSERR